MSCGYCRGMRTRCTCETDCGERGYHLCGKAPEAERRARMPRCQRCGKIEVGSSYQKSNGVERFHVTHEDGTACEWTSL